MPDVQHDAERLFDRIRPLRNVVVAFSGGVDSSVVAAAAARADLDSVIAVTARSPSVSDWQLSMAKTVAGEIGIEHKIIDTAETDLAEYVRNDGRRCFYCKQTLYQSLSTIVATSADQVICSGTNADDLGDYRPGIEAGTIASVRTPLADLAYGKSVVRRLAVHFGLSNAQVPASPCLASRLAYGVEVTGDRLRRVELAEIWLRKRGFSDCRVRVHEDERARVEVPLPEVKRLIGIGSQLEKTLLGIGFRSVAIDPEGLRSGNLNQALVSIKPKSSAGAG
jgi:uncharacterized protein